MTLSSWPKPWRRYFCRRLPRCLRRRWNCYPQFLKAKVANPQRAHRAQVRTPSRDRECWELFPRPDPPSKLLDFAEVKRLGREERGLTVKAVRRKVWDVWVMFTQGFGARLSQGHSAFATQKSCQLWLAHPCSTSVREDSAVASLCKEETEARKDKVVRNASLLPVPDHGMKSLYRFGFIQLTLGPGRNLTQRRLGLKFC